MSWCKYHIENLNKGLEVKFRPSGNSMKGKIASKQLCTVSPDTDILEVGNIVLCKVKGRYYLHLIKAIKQTQYLIGNNRGGINGWINKTNIYGKLIKVED